MSCHVATAGVAPLAEYHPPPCREDPSPPIAPSAVAAVAESRLCQRRCCTTAKGPAIAMAPLISLQATVAYVGHHRAQCWSADDGALKHHLVLPDAPQQEVVVPRQLQVVSAPCGVDLRAVPSELRDDLQASSKPVGD